MKRVIRFEMVMDEEKFRTLLDNDSERDACFFVEPPSTVDKVCKGHNGYDGYVHWYITDGDIGAFGAAQQDPILSIGKI